jgi:hypothetical protein
MGRYKMGPQGGYYDPNDSGPDQFTPTPGQQYPGMPAPQQTAPTGPDFGPGVPKFPDFPQLPGPHQGPWMPPIIDSPPGYDPNHPAHEVGGPGTMPWSESMPDGNGGYYNPGGHVDANGNRLPDPPATDMSGWPRKQYPGGMGGPIPPWMQGGSGTLGSLGNQWLEMPAAGGSGRYDATHPPPIADMKPSGFSLSSLGSALGSAGGNVPQRGGILGAAMKKLF